MDTFVRVDMNDRRTLVGLLKGVDRDANVCMVETREYWRSTVEDEFNESSFASQRNVGLVMVPGRHIMCIAAVKHRYPTEGSELYYSKRPNFVQENVHAQLLQRQQLARVDAARSAVSTVIHEALQRGDDSSLMEHKAAFTSVLPTHLKDLAEEEVLATEENRRYARDVLHYALQAKRSAEAETIAVVSRSAAEAEAALLLADLNLDSAPEIEQGDAP